VASSSIPNDDTTPLPRVSLHLDGHSYTALVDTGASRCCISADAAAHVRAPPTPTPAPVHLTTADASPLATKGIVCIAVRLGTVEVAWPFVVLDRSTYPVIIGADLLAHLGAVVDLCSGALRIASEVVPLQPANGAPPPTPWRLPTVSLIADPEDDLPHPDTSAPSAADLPKAIDPAAPPEVRDRLLPFLETNVSLFAVDPKKPGTTAAVQLKIPTGDAAPVHSRPYRAGPYEVELQRAEVERLLKNGLIRPSSSPWASPVVLVDKKDGSKRFCVDYRRLNAVTVPDRYPLPRIDDLLQQLGGARYFTTLDLASGYWQVPVAPEDIPKTAFRTSFGHYEWLVMPFGVCGGPPTFQRLMDFTLDGLLGVCVLVYLDDVIVYSRTLEEHLQHLAAVFARLRAANLHLKLSKCTFGATRVHFLGHIASADGLQPDPAKIAAVANMAPPTNIEGVRAFLGFCTYYRRFVHDFAAVAEPLNRLLRKGSEFQWTPECDRAFHELKKRLTSPPILAFPDPSKPFELHTDASAYAIGSVLVQRDDAGNERPVAYDSRTLSAPERNYSATERECLAVVWAVRQHRHLLLGQHFTVVTDHSALQWLRTAKEPAGRLARWVLELQPFNFTIVHRSGKKHQDADALSRLLIAVIAEQPASDPAPSSTATDAPSSPPPPSSSSASPAANAAPEPAPAVNEQEHEWSDDVIARAQRSDPELSAYIAWLEGTASTPPAPPSGYPAFTERILLLEGRLYYVDPSRDTDGSPRLIVPASLRLDILRAYHDAPTSGHLGTLKTLQRIRERFFWPHLNADVTAYVAGCQDCQRHKTPRRPTQGHLQPLHITEPWHTVHVDTFGPLPVTENGNAYVIVFTDHFTRWPEAFATASNDAETAARLLTNELICRYGAPARLLSDRGTNYTSALVSTVCRLLGVDRSITTAYHPQTDGLVERFNHTLANMLALYTADNQRDWDQHLPHVLAAYRSAYHPSIGTSPHQLLFGIRPRHVADVALNLAPHVVPLETSDAATYARDLLQRIQRAHAAANEVIQREIDRQAAYHDANVIDAPEYKIGSLVWLRIPTRTVGLSPKLRHPWTGPYVISELPTPTTVRITTPGRRASSELVNINRIKPYVAPWAPPATPTPPDRSSTTSTDPPPPVTTQPPTPPSPTPGASTDDTDVDLPEGYYPVDAIIGHRRRGRGTHYHVRWATGETTWEPARNIPRHLRDEYHATAPRASLNG